MALLSATINFSLDITRYLAAILIYDSPDSEADHCSDNQFCLSETGFLGRDGCTAECQPILAYPLAKVGSTKL